MALLCKHDWTDPEPVCVGVAGSLALTPTRYFKKMRRCRKCGDTRTSTEGFIYFRGFKDAPVDDKGWPLDEDGNRMPIYDL